MTKGFHDRLPKRIEHRFRKTEIEPFLQDQTATDIVAEAKKYVDFSTLKQHLEEMVFFQDNALICETACKNCEKVTEITGFALSRCCTPCWMCSGAVCISTHAVYGGFM